MQKTEKTTFLSKFDKSLLFQKLQFEIFDLESANV